MAFEKFNLTGKTALITGAAGLLGMEHAAALLECGASVVLTDINNSVLVSSKDLLSRDFNHKNISIKIMDVSDLGSIQSVSDNLISSSVSIDILINNAAINPKVESESDLHESTRLENFSLKQWNFEVAVGLTGAFLCSQVYGTAMAASGRGGVIVNIASDLSVFSPDQRLYRKNGTPEHMQPVKPITYSVIKSGLIGLTKYLATYWADNGVRCNALSPGGVYNGQNEEFVKRLSNLIPLGRMANLNEYRAAIQFLCSDASLYMNGQNIVIDGGRSAW
jgi:NAD(P)-dependent dehydrogenase (short-subunit alcohol dehydrogenase family)